MLDNTNIKELIIGIKHKEKFQILDSWGKIVDKIISNNEYFDSKYFPSISNTYTTERVLCNDNTGNYLKVTAHDIIYRHRLETDNFEQEYKLFCDRIMKSIVPNIIKDYQVENFIRIGVVFNIQLEDNLRYSNLIKKIINPNIKNVNDIRFSKKDSTNEGKLYGGINDYINTIYTISIKEDNSPSLVYDYQHYFNPIQADFRQCSIERIFEESKKALSRDIEELLGDVNEK